jgi:hypothetical protein
MAMPYTTGTLVVVTEIPRDLWDNLGMVPLCLKKPRQVCKILSASF